MGRRIGLTGGIGSGKSEVAARFARYGALVIDADLLAREAVTPGGAGLAEIARIWPSVVRDGELDRAALGGIVFADPAARERLNAIVHPFVRARAEELEAGAAEGRLVVHDVPLLFETRGDAGFDAVVLVTAPREARIARVVVRSGISRDEIEARMRAQIDPVAALRRATHVVENDGDLDLLDARSRAVYDRLVALT